jgi:hypothetical protein
MALREAVIVMLKSLCLTIAHHALESINHQEEEEEVVVAPPPSYVMPAATQPENIGTEQTDHQLWMAEQEMLRRVRPGSPLIDPDYDSLSTDIIQPVDLS